MPFCQQPPAKAAVVAAVKTIINANFFIVPPLNCRTCSATDPRGLRSAANPLPGGVTGQFITHIQGGCVSRGVTPAAQAGHRQVCRRCSTGMRASTSGAMRAVRHQQSPSKRPVCAGVHWLRPPHSGQCCAVGPVSGMASDRGFMRQGSGGAAGGRSRASGRPMSPCRRWCDLAGVWRVNACGHHRPGGRAIMRQRPEIGKACQSRVSVCRVRPRPPGSCRSGPAIPSDLRCGRWCRRHPPPP